MDKRKKVISGVFFIGIMGLTFYALFYGKDPAQIWSAVKKMQPLCLAAAMALALGFVTLEGVMIWYLLTAIERKTDTAEKKRKLTDRRKFAKAVENDRGADSSFSWKSLWQCISYSFTGFFYSGLTPSASGGQPMQLYYMCKDQHKASDASVILMTVAVMYKFVLVVIGGILLLFWRQPLQRYLGGYFSAVYPGNVSESFAGGSDYPGDASPSSDTENRERLITGAWRSKAFKGSDCLGGKAVRLCGQLSGSCGFPAQLSWTSVDNRHCYPFAKKYSVCADLHGLPGIRAAGNRSPDSDPVAGGSLYHGRHASPAPAARVSLSLYIPPPFHGYFPQIPCFLPP